jgi:Glutamine synthetase adenylyltransferase
MLAEVHALTSDSGVDNNFGALRFWKGREMTRVAVRELAAVAPLEETTGELSLIAEICLRRVFEFWDAELRQRYGSPKAEFAILALGKLAEANSITVRTSTFFSLQRRRPTHAAHFLPSVFQSTGKQDSRNIFEAASSRLAVSSGSAVAP